MDIIVLSSLGGKIDERTQKYRTYNTRWSSDNIELLDLETLPLLSVYKRMQYLHFFIFSRSDNCEDSRFVKLLREQEQLPPIPKPPIPVPRKGSRACLMEYVESGAGVFKFDKIVVLEVTVEGYESRTDFQPSLRSASEYCIHIVPPR